LEWDAPTAVSNTCCLRVCARACNCATARPLCARNQRGRGSRSAFRMLCLRGAGRHVSRRRRLGACRTPS
jgi:hypothetical protein